MEGDRFVKHAARVQYRKGLPGNMYMDVDPSLDFDQIVTLASDRLKWKDAGP